MKNLPTFFFLWLCAFGVVILLLCVSTPPPFVSGLPDTTYSSLIKSGENVSSYPYQKWLAYLFGFGIVGIFSLGLFLGVKKGDLVAVEKIYRIIGIGVILNLLVYSIMVFSWWDYTETNSMAYYFGLPKPSAWMFALMFIPLFISFFFVNYFEEWVYNEADDAQFRAILERRKKLNATNGGV